MKQRGRESERVSEGCQSALTGDVRDVWDANRNPGQAGKGITDVDFSGRSTTVRPASHKQPASGVSQALTDEAVWAEMAIAEALSVVNRLPSIREAGWLRIGTANIPVVLSAAEAYGWHEPRVRPGRPSGAQIQAAERVLEAVVQLPELDRALVLGRAGRVKWKDLQHRDNRARSRQGLFRVYGRALVFVAKTAGNGALNALVSEEDVAWMKKNGRRRRRV